MKLLANLNCVFVSVSNVCEEAPRPYTSKQKINEIFAHLKQAKKPLFIVGKGAAYAQAENELNKLVDRLKVPVLPTPMGEGFISAKKKD